MVLTSYEGVTALRMGDWKYIDGVVPDPNPKWLKGARTIEATEMLYNLRLDPREQVNALLEHPEIVADMKSALSRLRAQGYSRN